jgi:hypothetical protein
LLGAVVAARWRPGRPILSAALLPVTAAVPMVLTGLGAPWPVLAGTMLVPGACQTIYAVLWWTTIQRTFPQQVLARVNSWTVLGGFALTPAAVLAAGPLTTAIGTRPAATTASLIIITVTAVVLISPAVRRPRPAPEKALREAGTSFHEVDQDEPARAAR